MQKWQNQLLSLLTLIVKFDLLWKVYLIFIIKIFANFRKGIVTTITLFHVTNTNFVTVAMQYFLKLINPPPPQLLGFALLSKTSRI